MRMVWIWVALAAPLVLAAADAPANQPGARAAIPLSLKRAVEIALAPEGNTAIQLAQEALKQAQARSLESRAALLPDLEAATTYQNRTENLSALGIQLNIPIPGLQFPKFVGPFDTFDARASISQSVFDFSAIRRYQASKVAVGSSKSDIENSVEQVASRVARAYLIGIKADADLETAQANVTLSQALEKLASDEKTAGTGTGIEITRARVQLANDRQRLLSAQNARRAAYLQLLRTMNMRLDADLDLTDKLVYKPINPVAREEAQRLAMVERPDLKAQQSRENTAKLSADAVKMQRLPSLSAFGDYGSSGTGLDHALPTRTYGISVRVPIFDGGKRDAQRVESASQFRAEKIRTNDLRQQIELDVRLALDALQSADDQVKVSQEGLDLAGNELAQARRRYEAGVTNSIEVTDAQTRLERARDNQTSAIYGYNVAQIDLAQAMGRVRTAIQ